MDKIKPMKPKPLVIVAEENDLTSKENYKFNLDKVTPTKKPP
jgi:hypothetical protein